VICLSQGDYQYAVTFFDSPIKASLLIIFVLVLIYHAQTGLQVVIEDYIRQKHFHLILLYGGKFLSVLMAVVAVVSVFRIGA